MTESIVSRLPTTSGSSVLVSALLIVSTLVVLSEVLWIMVVSPSRRPTVLISLALGSVMMLGAMVVGVGYTALLRLVWTPLMAVAPLDLSAFWRGNSALALVVAFVVWDAIGWVYHWIGHRTAVGWAAHRPHHSGANFDITLALRQSWTPVVALALHPVMALLGFDLPMVVAVSAASNVWQLLEHSSVPVPFPKWFAAAVITPAAHRHHHATGDGTNLGPVLTIWDRVAGTWVPEGARADDGVLASWSRSANPLRLQFDGWREL